MCVCSMCVCVHVVCVSSHAWQHQDVWCVVCVCACVCMCACVHVCIMRVCMCLPIPGSTKTYDVIMLSFVNLFITAILTTCMYLSSWHPRFKEGVTTMSLCVLPDLCLTRHNRFCTAGGTAPPSGPMQAILFRALSSQGYR